MVCRVVPDFIGFGMLVIFADGKMSEGFFNSKIVCRATVDWYSACNNVNVVVGFSIDARGSRHAFCRYDAFPKV